MADDEFDYDEPGEQDNYNPRDLRQQLKQAKAEAKAASELKTEVETLRKTLAVTEAGLTLNDLQRTALFATHQGDLQADALKQTAQALGFITAPAPAPVVDDPSLAVHSQIAADAAGAETVTLDRDAEIDARLNKAENEEEFMRFYRESGRPIAG